MFAGKLRWAETINLERLVAVAFPALLIEKVSRVPVRRKVHRRGSRTRKDVGVELLDAERRFQHRFTIQDRALVYTPEESSLFELWGHLLRLERIQIDVFEAGIALELWQALDGRAYKTVLK